MTPSEQQTGLVTLHTTSSATRCGADLGPNRKSRLTRVQELGAIVPWALWAVLLCVNLILVNTHTSNYPFADELYLATQPLTLPWLWEQYAEHRVPLAKLVWWIVLYVTDYNFRVGTSISVLALGGAAFGAMRTARHLRGRTVVSDAFFSLALLNVGQAMNFLWWWCINHLLAPILACWLLFVLVERRGLSSRQGMVAGSSLVLLSLGGPEGLPYVLVFGIYLGYRGCLFWCGSSERHGTRDGIVVAGLAFAALLLLVFYFVGYKVPPGTAAGLAVPAVTLTAALETSAQVLAISLGPAVKPYWNLAAVALLLLLLTTIAVLGSTVIGNPLERGRAVRLLLFLGATSSLLIAVGWARAGLGEEYVLSGIYLNMALPGLCCAYFSWVLYGRSPIRWLPPILFLIATCIVFWPNVAIGLQTGRYFRTIGKTLDEDIRQGVPPFALVLRHGAILNPATNDDETLASLLKQMQAAGMPQFRRMAVDPSYLEVATSATPVMDGVVWGEGSGYSNSGDPSHASIDFVLPEPRFLYAIRLRVQYGPPSASFATLRVSWRAERGKTGPRAGGGECTPRDISYVETTPQDQWSRRFRSDHERSVIVWVNSMIDTFRLCPDVKPFSFSVKGVTLLVPTGNSSR